MKKTIVIVAVALALAALTAPLWLEALPGLGRTSLSEDQSTGQTAVSTFVFLDYGWFTGQEQVEVKAAPQVIAWSPGDDGARWSAESGFIWGAWSDSADRLVYLLEQRRAGRESLEGLTYRSYERGWPNDEWPLYLTVLDAADGRLLRRERLGEIPGVPRWGVVRPIGRSGDILYLEKNATRDNLLALNLEDYTFLPETFTLCGAAYPAHTALSPSGDQVYTLCTSYSTGLATYVMVTSLESGESTEIQLPDSGESWGMGNGLLLSPQGGLYVIDTDLQMLVRIDPQSARVEEVAHYARDDFEAQPVSLAERLVAWLGDRFVRTVFAKRYWAVAAISPDGRWLAANGGFGEGDGTRTIWLIDLDTMQAVRRFSGLPDFPAAVAFDGSNTLYVLLERPQHLSGAKLMAFDLATGESSHLSLDLGSRPIRLLTLFP